MLTSALVLITMLPLQVSPSGKDAIPLNRPLAVGMFVDIANILGLPKFKLRDSSGNRYRPEKNLMQEPLAVLQQNAGLINASNENPQKTFIQSYARL